MSSLLEKAAISPASTPFTNASRFVAVKSPSMRHFWPLPWSRKPTTGPFSAFSLSKPNWFMVYSCRGSTQKKIFGYLAATERNSSVKGRDGLLLVGVLADELDHLLAVARLEELHVVVHGQHAHAM